MNCSRLILITITGAMFVSHGLQAQMQGIPMAPAGSDPAVASAAPAVALLPGTPTVSSLSPSNEAAEPVSISRTRDPFWPVGYTPKVVRKPVAPKAKGNLSSGSIAVIPESVHTPQWDEAQHKLDIRGISLIGRDKASGQPKYLAMVAGRFVEEGDVVNVTHEDRVYRWRVMGIGNAGVTFQKLDVR